MELKHKNIISRYKQLEQTYNIKTEIYTIDQTRFSNFHNKCTFAKIFRVISHLIANAFVLLKLESNYITWFYTYC